MTRAEIGKEYFKSGYNCAQSVVLAFSDILPVDEEILTKSMLPFGSGIGRMREVCGAVSGMCYVVGLLYSKSEDGEQNKNEIYQMVQYLTEKFKDRNGNVICRELLKGINNSTVPIAEERNTAYYKKRPCAEYVYDAVEILEEFIDEHKITE